MFKSIAQAFSEIVDLVKESLKPTPMPDLIGIQTIVAMNSIE